MDDTVNASATSEKVETRGEFNSPEPSREKVFSGPETAEELNPAQAPGEGFPAADAEAEDDAAGKDAGTGKKSVRKSKKRRLKGLGSLQKEKSGIYTVRAVIDGRRVSKSTGTRDREEAEKFLKDFLRPYVKGDAERTYDNIQALVESDKVRQERIEDANPQMTIEQGWEEYLASPQRRDLAEATLEGKKQVWLSWAKWMKNNFSHVHELRRVSVDMVELYLAYIRNELAASSYNNRLCVLREMYRVLMKKARAKENPWEGMKLRDDDSHSRRELTIEELKRLAVRAAKKGDEWRKLFALGIYTGLRLGDCCRLNWKCVDVVRGLIQLIPEKTKKHAHGRPVTIPIHPALSDVLCETKVSERLGPVLPTIFKWYTASRPKVSYMLKKIFNEAGIVTSVAVEGRKGKAPEATFHSLRHTFVSLSANAGVPLHIVQSIVGHESTAMTRHYYHENEKALRQAVAAIPAIGGTREAFLRGPENHSRQTPEVEYFPKELEVPEMGEVIDVPSTTAPAATGVKYIPPAPKEIDAPDFRPGDEPVPIKEPEKPRVVIPTGAKVEIREFGRVYVDGVATGGRIGGCQGRPRPQKTVWLGECMRLWAKRKKIGMLEGTMKLVGNGGYKCLQSIFDQGVLMDASDALNAMVAYLEGRGIDTDE